jgi:Flp pilus assembly protein TadG
MWRAINSVKRLWLLGRAGSTSLEFALVSVLLFTLMFGITDLARYFLAWHGLNTISSEAARVALTYHYANNSNWTFSCGAPTSGMAATVAAAAPFLKPDTLTLCVSPATAGGITTVSVTASYPFSFMMPGLSAANGTLSARTAISF